jgi:hypothetical protein
VEGAREDGSEVTAWEIRSEAIIPLGVSTGRAPGTAQSSQAIGHSPIDGPSAKPCGVWGVQFAMGRGRAHNLFRRLFRSGPARRCTSRIRRNLRHHLISPDWKTCSGQSCERSSFQPVFARY